MCGTSLDYHIKTVHSKSSVAPSNMFYFIKGNSQNQIIEYCRCTISIKRQFSKSDCLSRCEGCGLGAFYAREIESETVSWHIGSPVHQPTLIVVGAVS